MQVTDWGRGVLYVLTHGLVTYFRYQIQGIVYLRVLVIEKFYEVLHKRFEMIIFGDLLNVHLNLTSEKYLNLNFEPWLEIGKVNQINFNLRKN